jgi:hypothetical protein
LTGVHDKTKFTGEDEKNESSFEENIAQKPTYKYLIGAQRIQ